MLTITIPEIELFDEEKEVFINLKSQTIQLEHSLVSLSKWESKWNKPFLTQELKSIAETIDYIKCMTITQNVNDLYYTKIDNTLMDEIGRYMKLPMSATTFANEKKSGNRDIITAEIIYYWMIELRIPFECQKWHLERLLTLINVCNLKHNPPKKMNKRELINRNRELNASRKNRLNTRG